MRQEQHHTGGTEDSNIQCKNILNDEHVQKREEELSENNMK